MRRLFTVCLLIVISAVLSGCGPAAQAIKRGDEMLDRKDHYGASLEYLTALRHESDNSKAKSKLCEYAKQGYEQKLVIAETCEKAADHECALKNYSELSRFIGQVDDRGCLSFGTVNLKQKITEMKSGASEKYYKKAEEFYNNADYSNAINSYQEALKHNDSYKDCKNKIAEANYKLAQAQVSNKNYREAHDYFNKANNVIEGYKDAGNLSVKYKNIADEKDALSHYENGTVLAKAQKYRDASEQFEKAISFVANFKDSQTLAIKYKEIADNNDAQSHYEKGMEFVKSEHYREATEQFEKSSTFISNYKESQSLSSKYKLLADEKDAKLHYEKGQSFFAAENYADAEKEFLASENFIKGYKDAIALAKKSSINESIKLVLNIDTPDYTVKEAAQKMINENNTEFFKVLMKQFKVENDYRVQNNLLRALSFYVDPDWFRLVKSIVDRGRTRQYDIVWPGIISLHGNICKANPKFDTCGDVIPFMCRLYCFDPDKNMFQGVKKAAGDVLQGFSWKKNHFAECVKMNPGCK